MHQERWVYRFDNFKRALAQLREAIQLTQKKESTWLEKVGTVQCFEFTVELAWKVLKDYLEQSRIVIKPVTPLTVIKEAFAADIIDSGAVWVRALDARNLMSHTYDLKAFEQIVIDIKNMYLPILENMCVKFNTYLRLEEKNG